MTEEEKQVILKLKDFIYRVDNKYKLNITNSKILKDILNLIDKQQKEIEELKENNKTKVDIRDVEFSNFIKERYISKDKIRDKIKEIDKKLDELAEKEHKWNKMNEVQQMEHQLLKNIYTNYYNVLKQLLEEN